MDTVFDDGVAANAIFSKLKSYRENVMLDDIKVQAENDPHIDWGNGLNVLLISDDALGRALGLLIYLSTKTNVNDVRLCMSIEDVKGYLSGRAPDIIIYVGMPKRIEIYQVMNMVNGHVMIVMCDFLDFIVEAECRLYGIRYAFSSYKPIKDGLVYLRRAFEDNRY